MCYHLESPVETDSRQRRPRAPLVSVVVLARNEGANLRRTVKRLHATLPERSEIVVVDDGSADGCADFLAANGAGVKLIRSDHLGVAKGRNLGARESRGDIIIFADAHISMEPGWWEPMVKLVAKPAVGAVAPTISDMKEPQRKGYGLKMHGPDPTEEWLAKPVSVPRRVPLLPGCCLAMRRDTFEKTGGFDPGMVSWGSNDNEISLRLWLLGYELWVAPQVDVRHLFRSRHPYSVQWSWVLHNKLRLAHVHFGRARIARVVEELSQHAEFDAAMVMLKRSDVTRRRAQLRRRRQHDDEWYFQKFGPDW